MSLVRDLRLTLKGWKKSPLTTVVIVLALTLGLEVTASGFITLNAIVLHPLPYPRLDRLMTLWEAPVSHPSDRGAVAPANFFDLQEQNRSFQTLAAYRRWDANLSGTGDPERVEACLVTTDFFAVLGFGPALGRTLRAADLDPSQPAVAVISQGFWKGRLAADPGVLGKTVSLNGAAYTIVGVMPADFDFPLETEVWAPLALTVAQRHDRAAHELAVLGRLKPGPTLVQARSEMSAIARRLAAEYPAYNENRDVQVIPIRELTNQVTDRFVVTLLVTAGFVLLLASANVANLLLVRLANRQREIAISTAMGATRGCVFRMLLLESTLLALTAGAVGLYLADWNTAYSGRTIPAEVLRWVAGIRNMRVDGTVVLFTLALSLVVGLLCALPSLIHVRPLASGRGLNEALKETGRGASAGRGHRRLRTVLAVSEVALAMILLVGAGGMVKTFQVLVTANPGFDTRNLLTMQVALPPAKYSEATQHRAFYDRLMRALVAVPAVEAPAAAAQAGSAEGLFIEGRPAPRPGDSQPEIHTVTGQYFQALRLPLVKGRFLSDADGPDSQGVIVLSETVARQFWPNANPIGSRVRLYRGDTRWLTVVGVAGDVKEWFSSRPFARVYVPFWQRPQPDVTLYVRTSVDPLQMVGAARAEVRKLDRGQPVFAIKSMEQIIGEETSGVKFSAISMVTYALIALFLAVSGIYAVISYSVAQRTHEIGIRMALGARPGAVLGMALADVVRIGGVGLGIGVPVAIGMVHVMSSVLYGVLRLDAATFATLTVVLAAAALAAGYIPALRAARVDPLTALRVE